VLDVRGLSFRYRGAGRRVLDNCALRLHEGERILLEGRSGGGKSTFAGLLVGLHSPEVGHILLRGLDRPTLGAVGWRKRVASAPQFHENHILSASLAFNLLMGRAWPPSEDDRREAEAVCRQLGLGPLLDKMPSGLNQIVGETGWQLSHGERSRVFLARALLQRSDLLVLDETFGALDPLTLNGCVETVLQRAPTMIVIAHP
jgi:ATP-binding cassette subfamily B protein